MSLLDDPIFAGDSYTTRDALAELITREPDRCIPLLATIATHSTGDWRKAAVDRLMQFKRADALRPLLPCLTDPQWSDHVDRHKLLTWLSEVDLPESVPFLMKRANSDDDSWRPSVVLALLHQHAPEADKIFRGTIEKMGKYIDAIGNPDWTDRVAAAAMAQLAVDRGMISDEQIVKAIEASMRNDGQGSGGLFKPAVDPSPEANLGMALGQDAARRGRGIADALFDRSLALRKNDLATAEAIWALVGAWPDNAVDRRLVILLSEQPLSITAVTTSMTRADSMRFVVAKEPASVDACRRRTRGRRRSGFPWRRRGHKCHAARPRHSRQAHAAGLCPAGASAIVGESRRRVAEVGRWESRSRRRAILDDGGHSASPRVALGTSSWRGDHPGGRLV